MNIGGRGGIRTPDTVARTPDFESGAFNHSATLPTILTITTYDPTLSPDYQII